MNVNEIFKILETHNIDFEYSVSNEKLEINDIRQLYSTENNTISFTDHILTVDEYHIPSVNNLIIHPKYSIDLLVSLPEGNYIFTDYVKISFVYIMNEILLQKLIIKGEKKTGSNVTIGKNTVIGDNVEIGDNVNISSNCAINNAIIGNNVNIYSGVIIGDDGFGYLRERDFSIIKFPHIGNVLIEDDVELHSGVCVARGTLGNTLLKTGVKVDNMVHIAHNDIIGKYTMIAAKTMISGSVKIGDYCWISPGCSIIDGIEIADNTFIGIGSVVLKDIKNTGEVWYGCPARKKI